MIDANADLVSYYTNTIGTSAALNAASKVAVLVDTDAIQTTADYNAAYQDFVSAHQDLADPNQTQVNDWLNANYVIPGVRELEPELEV